MLGLIKKIFIGLLVGSVNESNQTKCVSLSNQTFMTEPTLNNLYPNNIAKNFTIIYLRLN